MNGRDIARTIITVAIICLVCVVGETHVKSEHEKEVEALTKKIQTLEEDCKLLKNERNNEHTDYEKKIEKLNKQISDMTDTIQSQEEELKKLREESLKNSPSLSKNCLTKEKGVFKGPSGKETYYNLPMKEVVKRMRRLGYDAEDYPYWEREDGCKMLGEYIMVACNLKERPYGTIVATSLGYGIVCDTGRLSRDQVDIATNWR